MVLDLEDAVDPAGKAVARLNVADYLAHCPATSVAVRCNPVGGDEFERDMDALAGVEIAALVLPKISASQGTAAILGVWFAGRTPPALCGTIETAGGAFELGDLVTESKVFHALSWGPYDLAADLGLRQVRRPDGTYAEPIAQVRSQLLLAAAANGLIPLDTVTVRYDDLDWVARETREAADLGFVGKFAIHPSQIETIHQSLRPGTEDISRAQEVVALAENRGAGAVGVKGQMYDEALYRNARNTLAAAGQLIDTQPTGE